MSDGQQIPAEWGGAFCRAQGQHSPRIVWRVGELPSVRCELCGELASLVGPTGPMGLPGLDALEARS